jgi:hypothetical protein
MAQLTIGNPSLHAGEAIVFSFSGMQPYGDVWVGVAGGGGLYVTADQYGMGVGSFVLSEPEGNYTLEAYDNAYLDGDYSHYAFAFFDVVAEPVLAWSQIGPEVLAAIDLSVIQLAWEAIGAPVSVDLGLQESQWVAIGPAVSTPAMGIAVAAWSEIGPAISVSLSLSSATSQWSEIGAAVTATVIVSVSAWSVIGPAVNAAIKSPTVKPPGQESSWVLPVLAAGVAVMVMAGQKKSPQKKPIPMKTLSQARK